MKLNKERRNWQISSKKMTAGGPKTKQTLQELRMAIARSKLRTANCMKSKEPSMSYNMKSKRMTRLSQR